MIPYLSSPEPSEAQNPEMVVAGDDQRISGIGASGDNDKVPQGSTCLSSTTMVLIKLPPLDPEKQPPSPKQSSFLLNPKGRFTSRRFLAQLSCFLIVGYGLTQFTRLSSVEHNLKSFGTPENWSRPDTMSTTEKENLFLSIPNAESASVAAKQYSKHPHLAGSLEDYHDATDMLLFFQNELGITAPPPSHEQPIYNAGTVKSRARTIALTSRLGPRNPTAWIDVYYPNMDTPLDRSLDIVDNAGNSLWSADLREDGDEGDEDAVRYRDYIPAWHGMSGHGEGQGQLVFVNYGTFEDYEEILSSGQNLTGKIVIARYGALFRGLKVKRAEELGAAAVLIYSDPRDDGFVTVENGFTPYPQGPARNPTSVQRGSTMYLSSYPGDPTTPGKPAYDKAEREEATNIPKIPSLPISWANAQRLLEEIGDVYLLESDGRRRLSGKASENEVKVVNHVDRKITPIWNAMAAIPGHVRDEVVIIGCHRDAWVLGAADPVSGTVSLHEIVRGLGALLRNGWRPLRTILIASWDAEEYGLIGSTEYGEDFADWISEHAVAYLNVDVSSSGSQWNVKSSPSLAHLIRQTAMDVPHPDPLQAEEGKTLWDARNDEGLFKPFGPVGPDGELGVVVNSVGNGRVMEIGNMKADAEVVETYERKKALALETSGAGVGPMGSGSDYTVFLQRLGVASSDQGFGPTPFDAPYHYHSIYDSNQWQEVYGDPGFKKHLAVAKHLGLLTLRLTDYIIIPLNTTHYAYELDGYLNKVESLLASEPNAAEPESEVQNVRLAFSTLRQSIARLQEASILLDIEKVDAEEKFRDVFKRMFPSEFGYGKKHFDSPCSGRNTLGRRIKNWIKSIFGVGPDVRSHRHHHHDKSADSVLAGINSWEDLLSKMVFETENKVDNSSEDLNTEMAIAKALEDRLRHFYNHHKAHAHHTLPDLPDLPNLPDVPKPPTLPDLPDLPDLPEIPDIPDIPNIPDIPGIPHPPSDSILPTLPPIFEFIRAAKRLTRSNRKLMFFERGFIDEAGIKDREWYRHLGVAPGKWLGYGATTLPALTEAITIDKNLTAAVEESERLVKLLAGMVEALRV